MSYLYRLLDKAICENLNKRKLNIVKSLNKWQNKEFKRCFNLFKKGYSYKRIYNSISKKVSSYYKCKIVNTALGSYISYCKEHSIPLSHDFYTRNTGSNLNWVYDKMIYDFKIRKSKKQFFQVEICIRLPFEIDGQTSLVLEAKLPKKFWSKKKFGRVYKKGFQLIYRGNYVELGLVEQIIPKQKYEYSNYVKAIYVSPYGGLHIASCFDFSNHSGNIPEFYKVNHGCSKESNEFLKILNKVKDMSETHKFHENLELLKSKLRHRFNKHFEQMNINYNKIVMVKISNCKSKVYKELQTDAIKKCRELCLRQGREFELIEITDKELGKLASLTMKRADRNKLYEDKKVAPNKYRAAAIIKKYFSTSSNQSVQNIRLGLVNYNYKPAEMFSVENTVDMSQQELIDQDEYDSDVLWL